MQSIEQRLRSITEDRRCEYLWSTKAAARAVGCHPNKFGDWWRRTQRKLADLYAVMPGETAAEFACLIARAEQHRQDLEDRST